MERRDFASDNNAGAHPAVLAAITAANGGHVAAYGADRYTERVEERFRTLFGPRARTFFVFGGTGGNVVALGAALRPYQSVIVPAFAHLAVDECGAYERFAGGKLIGVPVENGKLSARALDAAIGGVGDQHHTQPGAVSISQSTEYGTVYTPAELAELGEVARRHGLFFHVDGARIANAAATLGGDMRAMLTETGVDAVTFGGTKNGLLYGEAIVFLRDHPAIEALPFVRKQGMQLASKMRFVAAQFDALLEGDLWLQNARHANRMAQRLAARVAAIPGIEIRYPVEANGVFAYVPPAAIAPLQAYRRFYMWDARASVVRWMAAFDTTEADIDAFAGEIERALEHEAAPSV